MLDCKERQVILKGITFGNYHSYDDFGLILSSKEIGSPEPKIITIDVEGGDGVLDFTEFTGETKFKNRKLTFHFSKSHVLSDFMTLFSTVHNALHGKKMNIILDDDSEFYYVGRIIVNEFKADANIGLITVECDCEPWKYKLNVTREKVFLYGKNLFDIANFEQGAMDSYVGKKFEELKNDTTTRLRSKKIVYCKPSQAYTINIPDGYLFSFRFYDKDEILLTSYGWSQAGIKTITSPSNTDGMSFYLAKSAGGTITVEEAEALNLQVEEGASVTEYEAFLQSKTVSVSLNNSRKTVIPIIHASGNMNIIFNGQTIAMNYETKRNTLLSLKQGTYPLTITGNGAVVFEYQEGGF